MELPAQTNYVLVKSIFKSSVLDSRSCLGANTDSKSSSDLKLIIITEFSFGYLPSVEVVYTFRNMSRVGITRRTKAMSHLALSNRFSSLSSVNNEGKVLELLDRSVE